MANFLLLLFFGGMWYGVWKLLHLKSGPIEHFVCFVYRSTYPPHPEDWAITHHIRLFRGMIWIVFGINSLVLFFISIGVIAAIGTMFAH